MVSRFKVVPTYRPAETASEYTPRLSIHMRLLGSDRER
jgi:hypothetical protein